MKISRQARRDKHVMTRNFNNMVDRVNESMRYEFDPEFFNVFPAGEGKAAVSFRTNFVYEVVPSTTVSQYNRYFDLLDVTDSTFSIFYGQRERMLTFRGLDTPVATGTGFIEGADRWEWDDGAKTNNLYVIVGVNAGTGASSIEVDNGTLQESTEQVEIIPLWYIPRSGGVFDTANIVDMRPALHVTGMV